MAASIIQCMIPTPAHILVIPAHLLWTSIVEALDPGALATSWSCLSATITEQETFVSVVPRGERVIMAELEAGDELVEIRPPATMFTFSLSLHEKENSRSPLSTTLRSRLATQVSVTSPTPPATSESERTERDTVGAETAANTR